MQSGVGVTVGGEYDTKTRTETNHAEAKADNHITGCTIGSLQGEEKDH